MRSSLMSPLRRHPVAAFALLAYAWTWALFAAGAPALTALAEDRAGEAGARVALVLLAPFGPTLTGLSLTALLDGRAGLCDLWCRLRLWRVGPGWYAFVLGWLLAVKLAGAGLYALASGALPQLPNLGEWAAVPLRFVFILLLGGPLGEEIGWRGFALPRLLAAHSPASAGLRLGLLWAFWHVPVFLIPGTDQYGVSLFWYAVMVTAYTFLFTFVHLRTGGSLWLALVHHTAINVALWLTAMPSLRLSGFHPLGLRMPAPWLASCGLAWLLVAAIAWRGGYARPVTRRSMIREPAT